MTRLVRSTDQGLYCEAGDFYIDPWRPVPRAVVTHAHSDHVVAGCGTYLTTRDGAGVLGLRVGPGASITGVAYGGAIEMAGVRVSLHPAGHVLGSAQIRVEKVGGEGSGEVCVVSGDYKTENDGVCGPFELVRCHTFITESTFGLPLYTWPRQEEVLAEINAWWRENQLLGRTSVVFAYPLGKAQRVLAGLDTSIGPVGAHGAIRRINDEYVRAGVPLPATRLATGEGAAELKGVGLVLAPPSANASVWLRRLAGPDGVSTAFVSGWMKVRGSRRRRHVDRGFVLSDHADWPALLKTIDATGAEHIGVTHGFAEVLVRWLSEHGRDAYVVPSRYEGETGEAPELEAAGAEEPAQEAGP